MRNPPQPSIHPLFLLRPGNRTPPAVAPSQEIPFPPCCLPDPPNIKHHFLSWLGDRLDVFCRGGVVELEGHLSVRGGLIYYFGYGRSTTTTAFAEQIPGCLLVVKAGGEEEGVRPGGAAGDGGAFGYRLEVCERQEATGGEGDAWEGFGVPGGDEGGCC